MLHKCTIYSSVLIVAKKTFSTTTPKRKLAQIIFGAVYQIIITMICLHSALFKIGIVTMLPLPSHALDFNLPICHTIKSKVYLFTCDNG